MDIEVSHEVVGEGIAVVRAVGELDVYTVPKWRRYLLELVSGEAGPRHVGLDFSEIAYFDSTAVGGLVRCWREHRDGGGEDPGVFALFSLTERTEKIMDLTGLARVITVLGSQEEFLGLARPTRTSRSVEEG
ncbi:anti-sigma factor antagonist [Streptomyces sp. NPDC006265]|uniref:anti-sigma factor antagonist n=1 Tax=Streptomyces sp. NPDC006265 TaxID=3156740 RepID=UPI0033A34DEE